MADLLRRILDASRSLHALSVDDTGRVSYVNATLASAVGMAPEALAGMSVASMVEEDDRDRVRSWWEGGELPDDATTVAVRTDRAGTLRLRAVLGRVEDGLLLVGEPIPQEATDVTEELTRLNNELATLARERARKQRELQRMEREARQALDDLERSYWHLRKVQEVLSFCMGCGRIRDADDQWRSFVDFLRENDILVSHAYCPGCAERFAEEHGLNAEKEG